MLLLFFQFKIKIKNNLPVLLTGQAITVGFGTAKLSQYYRNVTPRTARC